VLRDALPDARIHEAAPPAGDGEDDGGPGVGELLNAVADDPTVEVIGMAGGDGSVNAAAELALDRGKTLLAVPAGTLNHFARAVGLEEVEDAAKAFADDATLCVDVGVIDGKPFLNTASFGVYADLVHRREQLEGRIGKWPALVVALGRVLRTAEPCPVEINGERRRMWMIFVGNCRYEPSGFIPSGRPKLDDGLLDVRWVDADVKFSRLRVVGAVLFRRLSRCPAYHEDACERLEVVALAPPLRLARDGEVFEGASAFSVAKHPRRLTVYGRAPSAG